MMSPSSPAAWRRPTWRRCVAVWHERRWQLTFEGNIGRIVSIYETLVREPIVGIAAGS